MSTSKSETREDYQGNYIHKNTVQNATMKFEPGPTKLQALNIHALYYIVALGENNR